MRSPASKVALVLPSGLEPALHEQYVAALSRLGRAPATAPDGPQVAVGGVVPGAVAVVTNDPEAEARQAARRLIDCLRLVGVVAGPVVTLGVPASVEGALATALADGGFAAGPAVTDVSDPTAAFQRAYAEANGDVVGVVAYGDDTAGAAVAGLDANAQGVKVQVVGVGSGPGTQARIMDGSQCAAVIPAVRRQARRAVDLAAALESGATPGEAAPDTLTLDGEQVASILVPAGVIGGEGVQ